MRSIYLDNKIYYHHIPSLLSLNNSTQHLFVCSQSRRQDARRAQAVHHPRSAASVSPAGGPPCAGLPMPGGGPPMPPMPPIPPLPGPGGLIIPPRPPIIPGGIPPICCIRACIYCMVWLTVAWRLCWASCMIWRNSSLVPRSSLLKAITMSESSMPLSLL